MGGTSRIVGFNTLVQAIGRGISLISSFILVSFLTRYLGLQGYGEYVTVFAYVGFFAIIAEFGLDQILVKELALAKTKPQVSRLFSEVLSLRLSLILASIILAVLVSLIFPYSLTVRLGILIASFASLFFYLASALMSYFQVKLNFVYPVLADTVGKLTILIISLILIFIFKSNLLFLVGASIFGSAIAFLIIWLLFTRENINLSFVLAPCRWKRIFFLAWPLFLISFLNQVFFRIDMPLLSLISGVKAVGIYGLAFRIYEYAAMPAGFFTAAIFPVLAAQAKNKVVFKRTFKKSFILLFLGGLIFTLVINVLGPFLISLLGGEDFALSLLPLRILSLSLVLLYLSGFFMITLIILEKQKQLFYIYAIASILNIVLNLLFVPQFSYLAAAPSSVITQLMVIFGTAILIVRNTRFA